jgi:hypothetical protein
MPLRFIDNYYSDGDILYKRVRNTLTYTLYNTRLAHAGSKIR